MDRVAFSDFIAAVKSRAFPMGTPENLDSVVDKLIVDALIHVQRYVPCYQARHIDVYTTESGSYTACGITFIERPRGQILRIRNRLKDSDPTNADKWEDDCDVFNYDLVGRDELETVAAEIFNVDLSPCRLHWGNYTPSSSNIAVTPVLRATEQIELEWKGIKRNYAGSDLIPADPELETAVSAYVEMESARQYDKDVEAAQSAMAKFNNMVGEMVHDCREHGFEAEKSEDDTMFGGITFSFTADGGLPGFNQTAVAALIRTWNPDVLLFGGDNNYQDGAGDTLDQSWAAYRAEVEAGRVFPAFGNHDLDTENGKAQLSYFSLPGNGRYYRFRRGPVEFFCINSGLNTAGTLVETDGNTQTSVQALWLQAALANSDAKWKVVFFHHAPYTNSTSYSPGNTDMRWPFQAWGADVVLCGHAHNYERLIVGGFPYINAGTGANTLVDFIGPPSAESKKRYAADRGAIKGTADNNKLLLRFYNSLRDLIDIYSITK